MKVFIKKYIARYWLLFFFATIFLFMAFFKISPKKLWISLVSLELWQIVALILIYALISTFQIFSRKYLFAILGAKPGYRSLTLIHFSSMAAHYSSPAKLGFPLSVYLFKKFEEVPYPTGTAMILIELVVSIAVCGIIAVIGSYFYFFRYKAIFLVTIIFFLILCLIIYLLALALGKRGKVGRIYEFSAEIHGLFSRISARGAATYVIMGTFIQIFNSFHFLLLSHFFGANLSLWKALIVTSSAFFLGAISMIPMGLGVREASVLFYLHYLGITSDIGLSIVALNRLLSTGLTFALGIISGAMLGIKKMSFEAL